MGDINLLKNHTILIVPAVTLKKMHKYIEDYTTIFKKSELRDFVQRLTLFSSSTRFSSVINLFKNYTTLLVPGTF